MTAALALSAFFITIPETNTHNISASRPTMGSEVDFISLSRNEVKARNAAVKVTDISGLGHGSGTYFKIGEHHVVITAAHVVSDANMFLIVGDSDEKTIGTVIYRNVESDFATILINEMEHTIPMKFKSKLYTEADILGKRVFYTGFPGFHEKLFIYGTIGGEKYDGKILIMHSYAWPGSSGAGVFDKKGNLLGLVMAVDVNEFIVPQLTEDVVWVTVIQKNDIEKLEILLENI